MYVHTYTHNVIIVSDAVPQQYRADPWWVPERGHNDVLQGNEKEFFK
jgi:hypothetical protein